ncbi:MAG: tripartite tricarboxylate transporter permease [archaeon]
MIIGFIIPLVLGVLAGTFTGLAPGIHINLVATLSIALLASAPSSLAIPLVIFIVAMSITHTFIDFIPSIFLGAPEEDTFLSILPGHQLLNEGKGYRALILTLYGSIFAIPVVIVFTPLFTTFLPIVYPVIKQFMPFILLFLSCYLILRAEFKIPSLIVFILSGVLGALTFNLPVREPLMPLLSGLFGISSLIFSMKNSPSLTKQEIQPLGEIKLSKTEFAKASSASIISAPFCSILPGIGSGHAATIGAEIVEQTRESFLFLVGSINTIIMGLSFITVYSISKARSGTAAAVQEVLGKISETNLYLILLSIILSGIIAFFIGIFFAKVFTKFMNKINYRTVTLGVILIVVSLNIIFTNLLGLLVLATSTFLGLYTLHSDSKRIQMMGCLIVPSIVYYLF